MNRAWIPAGALASVSVAGLIALGPLTDSLSSPVKFEPVVTVSAPAAKNSAVPVAYPAVVVGSTRTAALTRGGAARATPTNSDFGQVAAKVSKNPPSAPAIQSNTTVNAPSAPATPVKKKTTKPRPASIGGSSGPNGDEGLASGGGGSGSGGGGEQQNTPASDPTP